MTVPRQVLPNSTVLITRRCIGRRFLLRPSGPSNELFLYILAVASERYGIDVHAFCVMSNHFHCVLTDRQGNLPAFEQYLDGLVARSMNALHGRWESFWAPGSYSAVRLLSPADVLDKIAYVLHNPVAAGLVRNGADWPGLRTAPEQMGTTTLHAHRPAGFFREDGPMPDHASLPLRCPPGLEDAEAFRRELTRVVSEREAQTDRERQRAGRAFLGRRRVLAQRPEARPAPGEPRRQLAPRVASRDKWKRIEALSRLGQFVCDYRRAWAHYVSGAHDTVFPQGTYWMRVCYGAVVAGTS